MRMSEILLTSLATLTLTAMVGGCGGDKADKGKSEPGDAQTSLSETPDSAEDSTPESTESLAEEAAERARLGADNLASSRAFLAQNALKEETIVLPSGLQYEVLESGVETGPSPTAGDLLDIDYQWSHRDGTVFDSSRQRGSGVRTPYTPQLGEGVFEGLALMTTGDRYRLTLPPELAFGEAGTPNGVIEPNEALIFEVKLIAIINAEINLATATSFLADNAKKDGVETTESGLQYKVLARGPADGKTPTPANVVSVHYRGTLSDGTEFDSSYARGKPIEFGVRDVIAGWTEGLQLMQVGDKFQFFIPPDLGYGEQGKSGTPIGPNEALVFEVELLEVK